MTDSWILDTRIDECASTADAPVMVLCHSLGSSLIMWDDLIPALTATYRVVRVNLPGHGGSDPAPIGVPLTMDALLDALERTLDSHGVDRFHFAGLSIGGLVAIAVAQRWGSGPTARLLSATDMASGPKNGTPDMWQERASLVREQGTEVLADATMERWFSPAYHDSNAADVARIRQAFVDCSDEGYAQCCEILETTDLRQGLGSITTRFGIVNGSLDAGFDNEAARSLADTLTSARVHGPLHVEAARHMCAMEQPAEVAEFLVRL